LFHLYSDCIFVQEKFELVREVFRKKVIDSQIGKPSDKKSFQIAFQEAVGMMEDLDEKANIFEWSRCTSAPFLLSVVSFIIGVLLMIFTTITSILIVLPILLFTLWAIFLVQGGFNWLFKEMIMFDLLKRYKIDY